MAPQLLKILKLDSTKPTFEFFRLVIERYQRFIPYENLSKLVRSRGLGPTLPSFAEYVQDILDHGHGGTCFAQNIYARELLTYLGFEVVLQGRWLDGKMLHPNLRVSIDSKNYFVDLGNMTPFSGPFVLDPRQTVTQQIGLQNYVFTPLEDNVSSDLQIFREGKLIRDIKSTGPTPDADQLAKGIAETFEPSAMFMTHLVAHKVFKDLSAGIWDRSFYRERGRAREVTELKNVAELKAAFAQLDMPRACVDQALSVLSENGHSLF
jgi:arylamine N-acetyltransferase